MNAPGYSDPLDGHRHRSPTVRGPRQLSDPDSGEQVVVEERQTAPVHGERPSSSLFFFTSRGFRRLWSFPADWERLSDDDLLALARGRPAAAPCIAPAGAATATPRAEPDGPRRTLTNLRVLVIDDDPAARYVVRRTLDGVAAQVLEAEGARGGIELARAARPDLIIVDYVMPDVSGGDAIQRLRADPATAGIPILIHTAFEATVDDAHLRSVSGILPKHNFERARALQVIVEALGAA